MKKRDSKAPSQTDWARVDAITDEEIDYSDIPELGDDFFEKATLTPAKQAITIRLDSDVVTWLKEGGKGYQTRANRILRSVMEAQRKRDGVSAPSKKGTGPS